MKLNVRSELLCHFGPDTEVIASIQAAASRDQTILSERLLVTPSYELVQDAPDARGERRFRTRLSGEVSIVYEALVDNGVRAELPSRAAQSGWCELPQDVLQYLTPSRYCPSDKFVRFAAREFGDLRHGGARVRAVVDWIYDHVDYEPGVSTAETTAERTFVDRAGVCRDFAHLGITFCRALGIPARAVSAYALDLDPPDFHAVFEAFLDGRWWLLDPTRLASVGGLVRIGVGRDAADIAFLTTSGPCTVVAKTVAVEAAAESLAA
jgi:transglutaminase-like putative cysteine protease